MSYGGKDAYCELIKICPYKRDCWIIGADLPPYCDMYNGVVRCTYENCQHTNENAKAQ